jgi:hypothetical protein
VTEHAVTVRFTFYQAITAHAALTKVLAETDDAIAAEARAVLLDQTVRYVRRHPEAYDEFMDMADIHQQLQEDDDREQS